MPLWGLLIEALTVSYLRSDFDDCESESNQDEGDANIFWRCAFLFQDDDAERHADRQAKLAEDLHIGDVRHEIHREEHENVSDGDDDTCDGRAPLALRDDFLRVRADGRRERDDGPQHGCQNDTADGVDRHGADVWLDLWDEFRDDLLGLTVKDRISRCAAGDKQDEQHLLPQVVLDAEVGEFVQWHAEAADEYGEHADDGRRRQRFAPTKNLRDDDDKQNGQGALDGIGR